MNSATGGWEFGWRSGTWLLVFAWGAGTACYGFALFSNLRGFRRLLASAREADPAEVEIVVRMAQRLGLREVPPVRVVDAAIPPLVWSTGWSPVIVLPAGLLCVLESRQREAVIAHELAHVRRRDHLVRWLEFVALLFFWWNPVTWFARRRLREAEEECCDAWVVWALPNERRSYARALMQTNEFLSTGTQPLAMVGSAFGRSPHRRRVEMIVKQRTSRTMSKWGILAVVAVAASVLPVAAQTEPDGAVEEAEATVMAETAPKSTADETEPDLAALRTELEQMQAVFLRRSAALEHIREAAKVDGEAAASLERERAKLEAVQAAFLAKRAELAQVLKDARVEVDAEVVESRDASDDTLELRDEDEVSREFQRLKETYRLLQQELAVQELRNAIADARAKLNEPQDEDPILHEPRVVTIEEQRATAAKERAFEERLLEIEVSEAKLALEGAVQKFEWASQQREAVSETELGELRRAVLTSEFDVERAEIALEQFRLATSWARRPD